MVDKEDIKDVKSILELIPKLKDSLKELDSLYLMGIINKLSQLVEIQTLLKSLGI